MQKDKFAEIATAVTFILIGLIVAGISLAVTARIIMWILGAQL